MPNSRTSLPHDVVYAFILIPLGIETAALRAPVVFAPRLACFWNAKDFRAVNEPNG